MKAATRLLVAACAVAVGSCTEPVVDDVGFNSANGETTFRLTDAPFPYDQVSRVDIFVVRLEASWAADTSVEATPNFVTVATVNRTIDLLALEGGLSDVLGADNVPQGAIKSIRLIIDTDKSSITKKDGRVLTGSSTPGIAWQSSAGIATLSATVEDHIFVPEGGTDVVVDFDVGRAFIDPAELSPPSNYQGFIFSPVLRAAQVNRTGSVSGIVRVGSSVGAPLADATIQLKLGNPSSPENTWATVATARSTAAGVFKFGFVTRTAFYANTQPSWRYMVVATKGSSRAVVTNVTVVAGQDTPVGSVIMPSNGAGKP
jgi:hypothetical protein